MDKRAEKLLRLILSRTVLGPPLTFEEIVEEGLVAEFEYLYLRGLVGSPWHAEQVSLTEDGAEYIRWTEPQ